MSDNTAGRRIVTLAVYFYAAVFLVGVVIIFLFQAGLSGLRQTFHTVHFPEILGAGLLAGSSVTVLTLILARLFTFVRNLESEFRMVLGRLGLLHCIILALMSGLAEETLFRGGFQPVLGLIPTSLIFGLAHFPLKQSLIPWTIFACLMGLLLGWLYIETRSLFTPIITHTLVNLVNLYRITHSSGVVVQN